MCIRDRCSVDRLHRFSWQAQGWPGALSVAVYIDAPLHSEAARRDREVVRGTLERLCQDSQLMRW
eukprot:7033629-Alexandrium_andersonii.AAC.1